MSKINIGDTIDHKGKPATVQTVSGGWLTILTDGGTIVKVRKPSSKPAKAKGSKPATKRTGRKPKANRATKVDQTAKVYGLTRKSDGKLSRPEVRKALVRNEKDGIVRLYPNLDRYTETKTDDGKRTLDNGDQVAKLFRGCETRDDYFAVCEEQGMDIRGLKTKYAERNDGMVRMNLGNRLRAHLRKVKAAK